MAIHVLVICLVTGAHAGVSQGVASSDFQFDLPQFNNNNFRIEENEAHEELFETDGREEDRDEGDEGHEEVLDEFMAENSSEAYPKNIPVYIKSDGRLLRPIRRIPSCRRRTRGCPSLEMSSQFTGARWTILDASRSRGQVFVKSSAGLIREFPGTQTPGLSWSTTIWGSRWTILDASRRRGKVLIKSYSDRYLMVDTGKLRLTRFPTKARRDGLWEIVQATQACTPAPTKAASKVCSNCWCQMGGWLGRKTLAACETACAGKNFMHASGTKRYGGTGDHNCACCKDKTTTAGDHGWGVNIYRRAEASTWTFKFYGVPRKNSKDDFPDGMKRQRCAQTFEACAAACTDEIKWCTGFEINGCTGPRQCNGACWTFTQNAGTIYNGKDITGISQQTYVRDGQQAGSLFANTPSSTPSDDDEENTKISTSNDDKERSKVGALEDSSPTQTIMRKQVDALEDSSPTQTIMRKQRRGDVALAVDDRGEVTVAPMEEEPQQ